MLDYNTSALMDGAGHFPFLWPKYPAGPYLALPGSGCLAELFPDFLLESVSWISSHRLRHLPPTPQLSHTHLAMHLGCSMPRHKWCLPPNTFWSITTLGKPASIRALLRGSLSWALGSSLHGVNMRCRSHGYRHAMYCPVSRLFLLF